MLTVCENELDALEELDDPRLRLIIDRLHEIRDDLTAALQGLELPIDGGHIDT